MRCPEPPWAKQHDRPAGARPAWRRWDGGAGDGPPWLRWFARPADHLPVRTTVLLTLFMLAGTRGAGSDGSQHRVAPDWFAFLLVAVTGALLLVRYRLPAVAVLGTTATALTYLGAGYIYGPVFIGPAVAYFAAITLGRRVLAWSGVTLFWGGHALLVHIFYDSLPPDSDGAPGWGAQLFTAVWLAAVVAVGELASSRREQWAQRLADQEAAKQRRADEERLRIARELHDVLAHSISVINVQAGVGLALLDRQPERAREALTTIKSASKEALGEVRQVLDALRTPGGAPRSPAPGLDRLGELTEQAKAAGLAVTVTVEGEAARLPPGTELAAFRIVQEALTNVVRHSSSRTARVLLRYAPDRLELRVDDDGPASEGGLTGGGNGLVGMRERAAALGGTVTAGPREDGGFRVLTVIPVAGGASVSAADEAAERETT